MISKTKLDYWCESVIEAGWLAALIVAPMFFNVFSSRVFEPDKISLLRSIALIMLLAWLVKLVNGGYAWMPAYDAGSTPGSPSTTPAPTQSYWRNPFVIPVILLILAYFISTMFSVARYVSWFGSYQRLQGTYSFLSYVIIAVLTAAHLRRPEQLRRLQHLVIVTSFPIAFYGWLQHIRRDPLPWGGDVTLRIAGNAGNAIFLAAYLIMAFFLTAERAYSSLAYLSTDSEQPEANHQELPTAVAGVIYLFIMGVQLVAIFWTQSRGPWLGLFLGIYLFVLLVLSSLRPRHYRSLMAGWVGLGLVGILVLVLMSTTSLFDVLRPIPYVGRLTQLLNEQSTTAQVRILIWTGASQMVKPHPPLDYPDGSVDSINFIRPLVGYGPEAMWVAYNPFYPPDLAHVESRNASPDRSHNETWDSLVITGFLGFVAYISLFITIFYWSLRWLGLLINRRDHWLFAGLLSLGVIVGMLVLFSTDNWRWRYFGLAVPAGLLAGLILYVMIAAFLHPTYKPERGDIPRLLLIIAILTTIVAHFTEIHFGIAIAATRTYFWVLTAVLLAVGMRWVRPTPFNKAQELASEAEGDDEIVEIPEPAPVDTKPKKRRAQPQRAVPLRRERRSSHSVPSLPATVLTDLLIFFTFVFIYTTNSSNAQDALSILSASISKRVEGGQPVSSPWILLLMVLTWLVGATVGLVVEALRQRQTPKLGWWLRGYGLHAAVVWIGWLIYGLIQAGRLAPGAGGTSLDEQLNQVAGHFAVYTWLIVGWMVIAGTIYAWPRLTERALPTANRGAISLLVGALLAVLIFFWVSSVNVALVRADIIYKQGQQFDNQRNWVSSIELYRRALNARKTEDHYMLFLGRALLEHAKEVNDGADKPYKLSSTPSIDEILELSTDAVQKMGRTESLRAAEVILKEAQTVNPLNTDHTANLARLYRTWADLSTSNGDVRQKMLDESLAEYNMAVTLSPNAAHLWNERGNALLAQGQRDQAEAAYLHSLSLDQAFDQTYLLLADFYDHDTSPAARQKSVKFLQDAIAKMPNNPQLYSYQGVALAQTGNVTGAIAANQKVIALQPGNAGAMRNLVLLYRNAGKTQDALQWAEKALGLLGQDPTTNLADIKQLRQLEAEIYQGLGQTDQVIAQYEQIRQVDPKDISALQNLSTLYQAKQDLNKLVEVNQVLMGLEPQNFQHPLVLAQAMQKMGQAADARKLAAQAFALAPADQKTIIQQFITSLH